MATPDYLKNLYLREGEDTDIFETANIMLLDKENLTRRFIDEHLKEIGVVPRQVLEISTMDLLIEFAKIGLGVAAVIKEFVLKELHEGTLVQIPLKPPVKKRTIGFTYDENNMNSALDAFLKSAR